MIQKAAQAFDCKPVSGMLSHQLKRNIINGEKEYHPKPYRRTAVSYPTLAGPSKLAYDAVTLPV